ncbi:YiaA/YiaB family inner membrane protein [Mycobacterium sp. E1747]|uniref:YiaA/YiaB family inner membrane protein n=1 Tax=Mycobacterium sp. E1747 TaxID=1834128 RepID=UPI0007FE5563|nr:YiaA/YiaB family inner membrane protein [Mycobacterium sp. E1747]OBH10630.1 hypothetical protein A5695_21390 [Mycobacterium sp. E1747]
MTVPTSMSKTTAAFFVQAAVAFAISFIAALGGIYLLPLDGWQRSFLGMTFLFLVSSAFTLAKVIRDQQEATTVRVRLDEARIEKLLADYDPLNAAAN